VQRFTRFVIAGLTVAFLAIGPAAEGSVSSHEVRVTCDLKVSPLDAKRRPISVTGTWSANDGGTYWIHQIGSCVWWTGFSGPLDTAIMGKSFSNVLVGSITSSSGLLRLFGYWADVPRGVASGTGTLRLQIKQDSVGKPRSLTRVTATGGFRATVWKKIS